MRDEEKITAAPAAGGKAAKGDKAAAKSASGGKSAAKTATAKGDGELNKPVLIGVGVLLSLPILLRLGTMFSANLNLWYIQMTQTIPFLGTLLGLIPLVGGIATFVYIKFKLQKKQ